MRYDFTQVFDIAVLESACNAFTRYSGMGTAILDLEGNIHVASGWQDICTQFHRTHPDTAKGCKESDVELANRLETGQRFNLYTCKNGLTDIAIPLYIDDMHVGNFFTGQFLLSNPDYAFFDAIAEKWGFDKLIYRQALDKVPVFTLDYVKDTVNYLVDLTELFGQMGVEKLRALEAAKIEKERLEALVEQRTYELKVVNQSLRDLNKGLSKLSRTDTLTKLKNRLAFDEYLPQEWSRAKRAATPIALLMIDIDHFKLYNDHFGHVSGDKCLERVAQLIKENVRRPTDLVARYGGEEFVCVLVNTDLKGALNIAQAIQTSLEHAQIEHPQSLVCPYLTLSIGVACYTPTKTQDAEILITDADTQLYKAKQSGRNQVSWSDSK